MRPCSRAGADLQAIRDELAIRFRDDDRHPRIGAQQRDERVGVEMIGVIVAGGDDVDEVEPRGIDDARGHAHVRLVGVRVLRRQRIRQIRVEQQMTPAPLHQEAALPQPPQSEVPIVARRRPDVGEQRLVLQRRLDHARPESPSRTRRTPSTMFASLRRAAQRAV